MKTNINKLKFLLFVLGFISSTAVMAQSSLTLDASQQQTTFQFKNSEGTADKSYLPIYTGAYSLGYRLVTEGGIMARVSVGMRNTGATMIYDDASYIWNLQYADAKLGMGYMLDLGRVKPYLTVSGYYAYLLKGTQTQNTVNYDLIKAGQLQRTDFGALASPGVSITLSNYISVYTEFSYLMGLKNIEAVPEGGTATQEGYNRAYSATLGLAFTITK